MSDKRLRHRGSPCVYCGQENQQDAAPCSAFAGIRPPQAGERFIGLRGDVVVAAFDFSEQEFAVFK